MASSFEAGSSTGGTVPAGGPGFTMSGFLEGAFFGARLTRTAFILADFPAVFLLVVLVAAFFFAFFLVDLFFRAFFRADFFVVAFLVLAAAVFFAFFLTMRFPP